MQRIGIIGCGNIGRIIGQKAQNVRIVAAYDQLPDRARALSALCGAGVCSSLAELLKRDVHTVVEAASIAAVRDYARPVLQSGRHLVVLSVGALMEREFRQGLEKAAGLAGVRIHVPSGAIMGLDNLRIGTVSRVTRLTLRTRKPPESLGVAVDEPTCLFAGPAAEGIERFPQNVNVAASVSLAAGAEAQIEIWADPSVTANTHEVQFEGEFGRAEIRVSNLPCPDNPKTSYLAALSVLSLLKHMDDPLVIGG